jgi:hypothetical protein
MRSGRYSTVDVVAIDASWGVSEHSEIELKQKKPSKSIICSAVIGFSLGYLKLVEVAIEAQRF